MFNTIYVVLHLCSFVRRLLNYYDFEKSRNEFLPESFYFSLDEEIQKIDEEMSYHNTEFYKKNKIVEFLEVILKTIIIFPQELT